MKKTVFSYIVSRLSLNLIKPRTASSLPFSTISKRCLESHFQFELETMKVETLREWMGIKEGEYLRSWDFKRRIIDPSKKELDANCPWSFDFVEVKENPDNKRSKVVKYLITPRHIIENENQTLYKQSLQSKITARLQLSPQAYDYLRYNLGFEVDEINKNKKNFIEAEEKIPDFVAFLASLAGPSRLADKPKAYIVGACRKKAAEQK